MFSTLAQVPMQALSANEPILFMESYCTTNTSPLKLGLTEDQYSIWFEADQCRAPMFGAMLLR